MDHGMVSKIDKARRYAEEPGRFTFSDFKVTFHGINSDHRITFDGGSFRCDCECFALRSVCSHTMALERLLNPMLT
jgi:hypothetical protein